jgi:predicted nuclease of predicted toxin-antitoxin system
VPSIRGLAGVRAQPVAPTGRVKLLLDVHVSRLVAARLRREGFEVVHAGDVMDPRSADEEILAGALRLGAVVVSRDQDFSALLAVSGATKPSLINVRLSSVDPELLGGTIAVRRARPPTSWRPERSFTLDDTGARVHRLPLG